MYNAEILLDSINPSGSRLTTMRVTFPRIILAEMNTHRVFSRNVASSRAISVERRIKEVRNNPFVPGTFGKNERGMQANTPLARIESEQARVTWLNAADKAAEYAEELSWLGVHKQLANRILEPFCWTTAIISSTEWDNFFNLRDSDLAQPEMKRTAQTMRAARGASTPQELSWYDWHVPMSDGLQHLPLKDKLLAAAGRIARVSYESAPKTIEDDMALGQSLLDNSHMSPFEHIAKAYAVSGTLQARNFHTGWYQYRAWIDHRLLLE